MLASPGTESVLLTRGDRGAMTTPRQPENGIRFKVEDLERRMARVEEQPVTELRVDVNYLKSEVAGIRREMREGFKSLKDEFEKENEKHERNLTWVIRSFVGACLTALVGILVYVSTQSGPG